MKVYDPIHGPQTVKIVAPVNGTPTVKLAAMTSAELRTRRDEVYRLLDDMRVEELGQPGWFASIPERRSERGVYSCEIRRIDAILRRRQTTLMAEAAA